MADGRRVPSARWFSSAVRFVLYGSAIVPSFLGCRAHILRLAVVMATLVWNCGTENRIAEGTFS
jgi:hypothetical protein